MKFSLIKRGAVFVPALDQDYEVAKKVKQGASIEGKTISDRNGKHHRLFFALLQMTFDNLPEFLEDKIKNTKQLLKHLKIQIGHYDTITTLQGNVIPDLKTISFAMSQEDFEVFFDKALDAVCIHFLPGADKADIRRQIEEAVNPINKY